MIKVAVVGSRSFPARYGGIETVCENLYSGLTSTDFKIVMYCRNRKWRKQKENNGIIVCNLPTLPVRGLSAFIHSFIATILATSSNADIIHFHAQGPAFFSFIPKLFSPGKKIVFTCHGIDWQRDKWNWLARKIIRAGEKNSVRFTDAIIVVSKDIRKHYLDVYGVDSMLVSNGIILPHPEKLNGLKERFNIRKEKYILFTGRLVPEKRVDILITAFNQINTQTKLVIAGDFEETRSYGRYLLQLAGDNPNIIFTSRVKGSDLAELYTNALAYISASRLEGNPLSVLEAMSYGLPVILSDIPPHLEILCFYNTEPVFRFATESAEDCKKEILRFLEIPPNDLQSIKKKSIEITKEHFSIEHLVQATRQIYANVLVDQRETAIDN